MTLVSGVFLVNGNKLAEPYINVQTQGEDEVKLDSNQYFVLGDNRGASSDSRVFGPIKRDSLRGRAWFVYWPLIRDLKYGGLRFISRIHY